MSNNIHGVGDLDSGNKKTEELYYNQDDNTPIYSKFNYKGDPRFQTIPSFLKDLICPFFHFKSFSFIVIVINVVIYIGSLIPYGLDDSYLDQDFLPPSSETLKYGYLYGYKIRNSFSQSFRWISGNFLHSHFSHIFGNCFFILVIGTMVEYLIGTWKYMAIYILSGILGSLFSVLIEPHTKSVGASISICGLIAAYLAFIFINWNAIDRIFGVKNKCATIMFPLIMVFMSIPFPLVNGMANERINVYGHLGGFLLGFFLSFIFIKPKEPTDVACFTYNWLFTAGIIACSIFTILGLFLFYYLDKYKIKPDY